MYNALKSKNCDGLHTLVRPLRAGHIQRKYLLPRINAVFAIKKRIFPLKGNCDEFVTIQRSLDNELVNMLYIGFDLKKSNYA